jgi:membrane dipeptidase
MHPPAILSRRSTRSEQRTRPVEPSDPQVARLHRTSLIVDGHVHDPSFLPPYAWATLRAVTHRTMPAPTTLAQAHRVGIHAVAVMAVGDPISTVWWARSPWAAVDAQLRRVTRRPRRGAVRIVTTASQVRQCRASGQLGIILGVEGADCLGTRLDRVDELAQRGVRVLGLVHLGDNQLGTTCLPWQRYAGRLPVRRRRVPGLTPFGRAVVERCNQLGVVIDVSHADRATARDIIAHSTEPVIASHSGARAVEDFERHLDDDQIRAIAHRGGLVGLWPYRFGSRGPADLPALVRHALHVARLVGAEHLGLGTDMNGAPGTAAGYGGPWDLPALTAQLLAVGFDESQVRGILGENWLRVFHQVAQPGICGASTA